MLSLPKHLARFVMQPFNEASKMLRQAQHDKSYVAVSFPKQLRIYRTVALNVLTM